MFPPFPQELAHHYCKSLISRLDNGTVKLVQQGRESEERKGQGIMLGSLVCLDKETAKRVILYANSGNGKTLIFNNSDNESSSLSEKIVPSLVSIEKINEALSEFDKEIHDLTDKINSLEKGDLRSSLIKQRTNLTDISLKRVFDLYEFTRFDGTVVTLNEIIKKHGGRLPPTGTGDCCAPKLLSYAFSHNLMPLSMDEVYYGPNTKTKVNGISYEPCDDRCGYILPSILGLEILYRDNDIIIVNKESGLLSVPGKGEDKQDCVESRVKALFPSCINQPAVHRLDMETSGVLVLAFNKRAHRELNKQFAEGKVSKKYVALLEGMLHSVPEGRIELKTRLDIDNRPYQVLDPVEGKLGVTEWKKLGIRTITSSDTNEKLRLTLIEFTPLTGRTHQLRLAAKYGLNIPIYADSLYNDHKVSDRLMLHSFYISFVHPTSHIPLEIVTPLPF